MENMFRIRDIMVKVEGNVWVRDNLKNIDFF
jgi:hypothetical protein